MNCKDQIFDLLLYSWCSHRRPLNYKEIQLHGNLDHESVASAVKSDLRIVECSHEGRVGHFRPTEESIRVECGRMLTENMVSGFSEEEKEDAENVVKLSSIISGSQAEPQSWKKMVEWRKEAT